MRALAKTLLLLIAILSITSALLSAQTLSGYHVVKTYPIPGNGGWDYLTFDSEAHRLYIAQATRAVVLDVDSGKVVGEVPNTPGIHGVALVPSLKRGVTSNGKANTATIFDLESLKPLGQVKTGDKPDAIIFDPATGYVFAFNGNSRSATAIDVTKMSAVGTVDLGGGPEFAASDGKGTIYVNLEDKNSIAVIDAKKMSVKASWPLPGCDGPTGLALDKSGHRVFSVCHSKVMDVINTDTGKLVATFPIGARVDAAAFDSGTKLAFSSNGDGTLTVVHEDSPDKFSVVENVPTQFGARTIALDPVSHTIYLVTAKYGPPASENGKPSIVPGTLTVLVVGK
jgi:DNA-binding beta-propeller fold protein YncE